MKHIENKKIAMAAIAILGMATLAAHASEGPAPSRMVRFSDLKPQQSQGAKMLYRRIRNAAEELCGEPNAVQLEELAAAKACVNQAVVAAVRAVNIPQLTETYEAHGGATQATLSVASIR